MKIIECLPTDAFVDEPTVDQFCTQCAAYCGGETCDGCGAPMCRTHGEYCATCLDEGALMIRMANDPAYSALVWSMYLQVLDEMGL